ncbi:MAG TPA: enoyl-[acyl-carrier-protein] reductase FabL [Anaerolineaceae bacterium]|nr:enoyl-[acyl-carrier-protein] reductase FabL [Anaerolineaceae bacterium]
MLPFEHKIGLVTGSSRGIGRAIARRLAREGADLVITFVRNRGPAEQVAREIEDLGRRVRVVQVNLAKLEDIERLFGTITDEFEGLDIFVSNAASGFNRPALETKMLGWDYTMNVNARAFLFAAQQAVPLMQRRGGGQMVAISSPGSSRVLPDYVAVGASKAALEALTRYLAVELAPANIRVNAVAPGLVLTDALQHFAALGDPAVIERAIKNTPAGRLVTPDDVADVVSFLCSPAAALICGQVIVLDGGYTLITPQ